jgi:UDP-N-acetylmuramate--alanine ligase
MIDTKKIEGMYFIGIGGIGMSALALYFIEGGYSVAGYDKNKTDITVSLSRHGCPLSYEDKTDSLPELFRNREKKDKVMVVYTPAIAASNNLLTYFRDNDYMIYKRSEILGEISTYTDTLAIAGTHGKTTVSTMTAHLLKQSGVDCSAFLGGISNNYNSNLLTGRGRYTVIEADEYDRSFLQLKPLIAVITSIDPDHMDIYVDYENVVKAYNEFAGRVRPGGYLIVNRNIKANISTPEGVTCFTYGLDQEADYRSVNIEYRDEIYHFDIETPGKMIRDLKFSIPGIINIENLTAAVTIALLCDVKEEEIRRSVIFYRGVKRRFDIRINRDDLLYVDDYAHHPREIDMLIKSIRDCFSGRKVTAIFQPHLYSRTRDHAEGFARSLDKLDEVILLPVYPAREEPVEGVSSMLILDKMKTGKGILMNKDDIPDKLDVDNLDILLTIGAGDIDTLVKPIEDKLMNRRAV